MKFERKVMGTPGIYLIVKDCDCKFSLLRIKSHHGLMFLLKSQGSLLCAGMSPQSSLD